MAELFVKRMRAAEMVFEYKKAKSSESYILKTNLECGEESDYIIVIMGCYDYCDGDLCEKRIPTPSKTTAKYL